MPRHNDNVPAEITRIILYATQLCWVSMAGAVYFNQTHLLWITACVYATSVNYWRHPVKGLRRNVDICTVHATCTFTMHTSFQVHSAWFVAYWLCIAVGLVCYETGKRLADTRRATVSHTCTHVCANAGNLCLYAGLSCPTALLTLHAQLAAVAMLLSGSVAFVAVFVRDECAVDPQASPLAPEQPVRHVQPYPVVAGQVLVVQHVRTTRRIQLRAVAVARV